jgi:hypothetical protein
VKEDYMNFVIRGTFLNDTTFHDSNYSEETKAALLQNSKGVPLALPYCFDRQDAI